MSNLKVDGIVTKSDNTDLSITAHGSGKVDIETGFKVSGTAGVPIADLRTSSGTAGSGTFLRGDGQWQAAGGGAWTLISSTTASDDASITVTGITSTYASHAIFISDLVPASNDIRLYMRVGDSSGIDSGASDYSWRRDDNDGYNKVYAAENDTSDSEIELQTGAGSNTGEASHGRLYLMNPSGSSNYPFISGQMTSHSHTDMVWGGSMMAMRNAAITMDRFQLFYSSGNITSGRITLWGIANA